MLLLRLVPIGDEAIAERQAGGGVGSLFVAVEQAAGQGGLDMTDDLTLEAILVLETLDRVLLPSGALGLGNGGYHGRVLVKTDDVNAGDWVAAAIACLTPPPQ